MIVLISRGYVTRHAGIARALAAVGACALLAGCGGGGGAATPPASGTGSAAAPIVSGSGAGVQDQAVSGGDSSGGGGATAGSLSRSSAGSISSGSVGSISHSSNTTFSVTHSVQTHVSKSTQIVSATQAKRAQQQANQATQPANTTTTPSNTATTGSTHASATQTQSSTNTAPPTRTKVVYVTRTRIYRIWRTRTITKTVTKTVPPQVPAGAFMPSTRPELAQHSFTTAGGNIGCVLALTGVRCGITHRSWTAPAQPKHCNSDWGSTLALANRGLPMFSCGGSNPADSAAKLIPAGWDTTVGNFTCQVRSFGVDCFDAKSHSGFLVSRTGYSIY
jgi:hypothetical protein